MQLSTKQSEYSLRARPDRLLTTPAEFAEFITELTDEQIASKAGQPIDVDEFRQACDSFNLARLAWRLEGDFGIDRWGDEFVHRIIDSLCGIRSYDKDEFRLAIEATKDRARFPFGMRPLEEAFEKATRRPLVLQNPSIRGAKLLALIATIAFELQFHQKDQSIILPVDQLRRLLRIRKLLIGGALKVLVAHKILDQVDGNYFPGKAREYRFIAREGIDFCRADDFGS